jgi:hypothetical protein
MKIIRYNREVILREYDSSQADSVRMIGRNPVSWPGCYPLILITESNEVMCQTCVRDNYRTILSATLKQDDKLSACALVTTNDMLDGQETYCCECDEQLADLEE